MCELLVQSNKTDRETSKQTNTDVYPPSPETMQANGVGLAREVVETSMWQIVWTCGFIIIFVEKVVGTN